MKNYNKFKIKYIILIVLFSPYFVMPGFAQPIKSNSASVKVKTTLEAWVNVLPDWKSTGKFRIDSVSLISDKKLIRVYFTRTLSYMPVREENFKMLQASLEQLLEKDFRNHTVEIYTDNQLMRDLIPNAMRKNTPVDVERMLKKPDGRVPLVRKAGEPVPSAGLYSNNIALWASHGWYFESKLDRWEWQRARLFGTVEDISSVSFMVPYLVRMLENSGAQVFLPRERDWQTEEIIVDNDLSSENSELILPPGIEPARQEKGFKWREILVSGENPFLMGTSLIFESKSSREQPAFYIPHFKKSGEYAVYVSWQSNANSSPDVRYSVLHSGGKTDFLVNQQISGGTWVYLGTFGFAEGKNPETGAVTIDLQGDGSKQVSVDAVRFGGGMGNVARKPFSTLIPNEWSLNDNNPDKSLIKTVDPKLFSLKTSGKPRWAEGARYYLQYAGFPDTLIYSLNESKNDYNDDYQSRGEWVNYLMGKPNGPQKARDIKGLNIPVDLAFAFHTDAGMTKGDSIIGTLGIYSTWSDNGKFPTGKSRMASRDLSDLIQSQLVDDIRALFNQAWTRRGLWDRQYSEAWRPNVPVMLLELLSHQNLADMKFGLDPRFRFAVGRSIYKGMLRFLAFQEGRNYVVQPLPVSHFSIARDGESSVKLSWRPVTDTLEPTANPTFYKVYKRIGDTGFDNGMLVKEPSVVINLPLSDQVYSFRITALNEGGESFPGEILSVGLKPKSKGNVLVVNAFDRICAPASFDEGSRAGLAWWEDHGVADRIDLSFIGFQYDFNRKTPWTDDDNPGWGSSYGDQEGKVFAGNSFDFPAIHGKAILEAGYSFISTSDEVFSEETFDPTRFFAVDVILGEEKSTPLAKDTSVVDFQIYTPGFMRQLKKVANDGENIFITGAYIGTDLATVKDSVAIKFASEVLHFNWRTNHASKGGAVYSTDYGKKWFDGNWNFNTTLHPVNYTVEAPDGIEPASEKAITAFRYSENNVSAGVSYSGKSKVVALGFPFEAISETSERNELMHQVLTFFAADESNLLANTEFAVNSVIDPHGALVRGDTTKKVIYLIFSADEFGEGAPLILKTLSKQKVKASFFLTGNFLRNQNFEKSVKQMVAENHFLGPHSDRHLLYATWENRDSTLITRQQFANDLNNNFAELEKFGVNRDSVLFYLPPYEWYNSEIALWGRKADVHLVNFTPGIGTNADYTTPDMNSYKSSKLLFENVLKYEKSNSKGLNGAVMLIHLGTHPSRTDKFYKKLKPLIKELKSKGYTFKTLN